MALEGVVVTAGGLHVAQRGADAPHGSLRVEDVAPIATPRATPTEARRSDGVVWRRHWFDADRLVIEFVDVAVVEVEDQRGTVTFDRFLLPEMEQHLLFDHVLPLVLACRGEVVVHGGVISLDGRGAVLLGASGAGKSTLTAFAWKQGWTVGGDDGAVLTAGDPPTVEPTYATVRLTPTSAELLDLGSEASSPVVGKLRLPGSGSLRFRQSPVELGLIVRLEPADAGAEASLKPLRGVDAHAVLFSSTFHAELRGHLLLPAVVERLAAIVETTTIGQLAVPRGLAGLDAAERLLRAYLGRRDRPAAAGGGQEAR